MNVVNVKEILKNGKCGLYKTRYIYEDERLGIHYRGNTINQLPERNRASNWLLASITSDYGRDRESSKEIITLGMVFRASSSFEMGIRWSFFLLHYLFGMVKIFHYLDERFRIKGNDFMTNFRANQSLISSVTQSVN